MAATIIIFLPHSQCINLSLIFSPQMQDDGEWSALRAIEPDPPPIQSFGDIKGHPAQFPPTIPGRLHQGTVLPCYSAGLLSLLPIVWRCCAQSRPAIAVPIKPVPATTISPDVASHPSQFRHHSMTASSSDGHTHRALPHAVIS